MSSGHRVGRSAVHDGGPCGDPSCYRGGVSKSDNYQFKDGPCNAVDCKWPLNLPPRPHPSDISNLSKPIVDAGAIALKERRSR